MLFPHNNVIMSLCLKTSRFLCFRMGSALLQLVARLETSPYLDSNADMEMLFLPRTGLDLIPSDFGLKDVDRGLVGLGKRFARVADTDLDELMQKVRAALFLSCSVASGFWSLVALQIAMQMRKLIPVPSPAAGCALPKSSALLLVVPF